MLSRFFELTRQGVKPERAEIEAKAHKGGGSTTQSNEPPAWAAPHLKSIGEMAGNLSGQPQSYFPGSTVVPFSPETQGAMQRLTQYTRNPNSAANLAVNQFRNTIQGDFLPGGGRFNAITNPTVQAINAQFSNSGRYGSGMHQQAVAKGMMEAAQPYYDAERGRMMSASAAAPSAQMGSVSPLLQVGGMLEGKGGEYIQDALNRWDFAQNEPWDRLARYAGIINPGAGIGGTRTTTLPGGSPFAGALSGGVMGAQLGSLIPGFGGGAAGATGLAALGPAGIGLGLLGAGLGLFA